MKTVTSMVAMAVFRKNPRSLVARFSWKSKTDADPMNQKMVSVDNAGDQMPILLAISMRPGRPSNGLSGLRGLYRVGVAQSSKDRPMTWMGNFESSADL